MGIFKIKAGGLQRSAGAKGRPRGTMSRTKRAVLGAVFALYGIIMLWLLFGQRLGADAPGAYWERLQDNVNLIPFFTIRQFIRTASVTANPYLVRHAFINLAGNVVMFVPLGFFPPCLWDKPRGFGRCMLRAAACIVAIEIIQLFTLLGSCDVDDLMLNMAGAAIGYGVYRLLSPRPPAQSRRRGC